MNRTPRAVWLGVEQAIRLRGGGGRRFSHPVVQPWEALMERVQPVTTGKDKPKWGSMDEVYRLAP